MDLRRERGAGRGGGGEGGEERMGLEDAVRLLGVFKPTPPPLSLPLHPDLSLPGKEQADLDANKNVMEAALTGTANTSKHHRGTEKSTSNV